MLLGRPAAMAPTQHQWHQPLYGQRRARFVLRGMYAVAGCRFAQALARRRERTQHGVGSEAPEQHRKPLPPAEQMASWLFAGSGVALPRQCSQQLELRFETGLVSAARLHREAVNSNAAASSVLVVFGGFCARSRRARRLLGHCSVP